MRWPGGVVCRFGDRAGAGRRCVLTRPWLRSGRAARAGVGIGRMARIEAEACDATVRQGRFPSGCAWWWRACGPSGSRGRDR